jgi:hypothetical protein
MVPGVNTGTAANPEAWGPEVAFAQAFHQARPWEVLFLVKSVKGSTGLAQDSDCIDWSPDSEHEMFDLTSARVAAASASLGGMAVDAVLLFQGEQDAFDAEASAAYADNLRDWLAAIRSEWMHDSEGQIAFGRVGEAKPFGDTVRDAQVQVDAEDANVRSFETQDFQMQADGLHYAAEGFVRIGEAFYSAYGDAAWDADHARRSTMSLWPTTEA